MKRQIDTLTPLRGIAAILVVILHFSGSMLPNLDFTKYTHFFFNGYLWVDFFLILSGFIMMHAYAKRFNDGIESQTYRKFIFARFARVYPLHLFALFLFIGYELFRFVVRTQSISSGDDAFTGATGLSAILSNVLLIHSLNVHDYLTWNSPSWSISVEFYTYMLFPFLVGHFYNIRFVKLLLAYCGCIAGLFFLTVCRDGHLDITYDYGFIRCFFEFIAGMLLYNLFRNRLFEGFFGSSFTFVVAAICGISIMHLDLNDVLIIPVFSVLILAAAQNAGLPAKILNTSFLNFLGEISYSIYLMHAFLQIIIMKLFKVFLPPNFIQNLGEIQSLGVLFVLLIFVCFCSAITYRVVEIRSRDFLNRLIKPTTSIIRKYELFLLRIKTLFHPQISRFKAQG